MIPRRKFGPLDLDIPIMGQGTWQMELNPQESQTALLRGIETGMTHIDTAEMYGDGQVEEILAPVIKTQRQDIFLVSKVLPSNASTQGTIQACEQSLKRLGTDWLDLYLLHWRGSIPLEETINGFEKLLESGKIRAYGLSNFDVADLEDAYALTGPNKIACNQVLYHSTQRAIETRIAPWCKAKRIALVGYSPLGQGHFPGIETDAGEALNQIAQQYQTSPQEIALAFLLRDENTFLIPKASKLQHLEANARAATLQLSQEEIVFLEKQLH